MKVKNSVIRCIKSGVTAIRDEILQFMKYEKWMKHSGVFANKNKERTV